jgi:hypothetical protein
LKPPFFVTPEYIHRIQKQNLEIIRTIAGPGQSMHGIGLQPFIFTGFKKEFKCKPLALKFMPLQPYIDHFWRKPAGGRLWLPILQSV